MSWPESFALVGCAWAAVALASLYLDYLTQPKDD